MPDDIINDLIESAASKSYDKIQETVSNVIASGYFGKQIIEQVKSDSWQAYSFR